MTGMIYRSVSLFKAWLANREARAQVELLKAYEASWRAIESELAKVSNRIEASASDASPSLVLEQRRLRELERQVVEEIRKVGQVASDITLREQSALVSAAEKQAARLIRAQLKARDVVEVSATFSRLPIDVIEQLVGFSTDGSPIRKTFDALARDLGLETGERIRTALIQGAVLGQNPREIARTVRRAAEAKGDNPMRAPAVVRRLNQTMRNESYRALREASRTTYNGSAVTKKWRWVSSLDPRACVICWAMHGQMFPLSVPMESHIACRCVMVPVLDESAPFETGTERFAKLELGFQKQILGSEAAYEAYKSGQVKLEDFVGIRESERWGRSRHRRRLKDIISSTTDTNS